MKSILSKSICLTLACLLVCAAFVAVTLLVSSQTAYAYDSNYPQDRDLWDEGTFTELTYGIYWYDNDSSIPKKAGDPQANFDPNKPTFIFTHGMKEREGYHARDLLSLHGATDGYFASKGFKSYADESGYDVEFYRLLLQKGYNVGQFYWSQLAEESITGDLKIWTSDSLLRERYIVCDEEGNRIDAYRYADAPEDSVAVLYGNAIMDALGADYAQPLRIAGHSMGGQLSLAVTQYLVALHDKGTLTNTSLIPERVSLLDPYLSMTPISTSGMVVDGTGYEIPAGSYVIDLAAKAMDDITAYGVAVDVYAATDGVYRLYQMPVITSKTSTIEDYEWVKDITDRLTKNATWTFMTDMGWTYNFYSHTMMVDYYFTTMYEQPVRDNWGTVLPGLFTTTDTLLSMRGMLFQQQNTPADKNPFWQHNSSFVRCTGYYPLLEDDETQLKSNFVRSEYTYYEVVGTPIEGSVTADIVRVKLLDADGNVVYEANVTDGKYAVKATASGDYRVVLYSADMAVGEQTFTVTAPDSVTPTGTRTYAVLRQATLGTTATLLDAQGNVIQSVEVKGGQYAFSVDQAGKYTVNVYNGDDLLNTGDYEVGEDMTVTSGQDKTGLKLGQIFMIVILCVIGVALVVLVIIFGSKSNKKKKKNTPPDYSR